MKRRDPRLLTTIYLAAIALLALALRVARLDFQPLWWDEGYTVFFATRDFATMVARTAIDIHPPLYYALLQAWILLAGKSDVALRLFSVGIGVAIIPLIYLIARRLFNRRVGIIAAFLLAISPLHVYYSQEVRMYGLVTLLALGSIALQLVLLARQHPSNHSIRSRQALLWLSYVIVTAAALYAQYYSAFVLLAEVAVVIYWKYTRREDARAEHAANAAGSLRTPPVSLKPTATPRQAPSRQAARIRPWISAWVAIFILYLPWLIYAGPKLYAYVTAKVGIEQYSRLDPFSFLAQHLAAFSVGHLSAFPWLVWSTPVFIALLALGVLWAFRHPDHFAECGKTDTVGALKPDSARATQVLLIYLLLPLLCGWLISLVYPFHPVRYERLLLFAAPPFFLLVALGLDPLFNRRARWAYAAIGVIILISAASLYDFYTVPRYPDEDYRPLIREMESMAQAGDVVLAPYPWQIGYLESYYLGSPLQIVEVPSDEWISQPGKMESGLNSIRGSSPRAWLLAYQTKGRLLEDQIANYFADDYRFADDWFGNTRLEYFAQVLEPPLNENAVVFAPDLKLASFGVGTQSVAAGAGFVPVRLHWEAASNTYSYSLRLVDRAGVKQLQQDEPIAAGNEIERLGLFVPHAVVGGEYKLFMVVYLRADGSPVALPDGSHELPLAGILVNAP